MNETLPLSTASLRRSFGKVYTGCGHGQYSLPLLLTDIPSDCRRLPDKRVVLLRQVGEWVAVIGAEYDVEVVFD